MEVPTLEVDFYQASLLGDKGISKPIIVTASDGNDYYVKNQNIYIPNQKKWICFNADFFQEFLTSKIANILNIPTPDIAIINISDELLSEYPELRWNQHFNVGPHFATKKIEHVQNNLIKNYEKAIRAGKPYTIRSWNEFFASVKNKGDISKIIALDLFTMNVDRFTNINNLIVSETEDGRKIISFDYGHCFLSPHYNASSELNSELAINDIDQSNSVEVQLYAQKVAAYYRKLSAQHGQLKFGLGIIFQALQKQINFTNNNNPFNPFGNIINQMENIQEDELKQIIESIPEEWVVGAVWQKNEYLEFLKRQESLTRYIILRLAMDGYFDNFEKGGTLKWQTEKNISMQ